MQFPGGYFPRIRSTYTCLFAFSSPRRNPRGEHFGNTSKQTSRSSLSRRRDTRVCVFWRSLAGAANTGQINRIAQYREPIWFVLRMGSRTVWHGFWGGKSATRTGCMKWNWMNFLTSRWSKTREGKVFVLRNFIEVDHFWVTNSVLRKTIIENKFNFIEMFPTQIASFVRKSCTSVQSFGQN